MSDQTIPAEKVRELADKYDQDSSGNPERLLVQAIADLRALLPTQQPTTGLLGQWVKDKHGIDAMIESDRVDEHGDVYIVYRDEAQTTGSFNARASLSSLTFPHQATRPEDVPAGEAWLVRHVDGGEFNALKTSGPFPWRFFNGEFGAHDGCRDVSVTLISPLTPERPVSDLQAKYDALDAKYREAQERIKALEQPSTPRTVTTEHDYAALPVRSVVAGLRGETWEKTGVGLWSSPTQRRETANADLAGNTRTVLRYGWGDEQPKPAWRIEHDPKNLREGEYIIDKDGDTGTLHETAMGGSLWCKGGASSNYVHAPWIVFPNEYAATPDAVAEATEVRNKETEE